MTKSADPTQNGASDGEALLSLMETRRSAAVAAIGEPGPDDGQLRRILTIACRAPDHGALEPWRFILIEGEARADASREVARSYAVEYAATEPAKLQKFTALMARIFIAAPVTIIVVSSPDPAAKISLFEQELSAGAVCMNLLTAANALGFDANWVTGFAATSVGARALFGVRAHEKVAGVIFLGTAKERPAERKRPDIDAIVSRWTPA
ncbi:nitroreductase family protein [Methylocella silvestris]|uniref:Putative NAD(P)H nitroreductase n=1 Tax=Methylocella silvestris TaxID=199596 RepID=A0A2J7TIQ9_METSI|nr:nitroreductase [Methylocella silvestris]PNG26649.1 nitroreductase [Methylocella silvestris]